ncbi:aspartate kinase [Aliikangiella coralliicola]|uniref:Aspartokinase n=1 Tax=Aliikangiella coralliicola TaxID=2592383 RepID=A0A545TZW6_9GAMM|nr:aspartate kinase [Aliikangiella coralliicola]TQV82759.1 aspartate kinase [Aliikangiella coralliicola]
MKVLKFGGTSLGDAQRMRNVADIVCQQGKVLVVLSAVAGTTDSLVRVVDAVKHGELAKARNIVEVLQNHYQRYIDNLYRLETSKSEARDFVEAQLADISDVAQQRYVPALEFHILAKGELISTELFSLLLREQEKSASLLSALDFLRLNQDSAPDEDYLSEQLSAQISNHSNTDIFVTQGFICRNAFGEICNLKRGGSDYSASLFAAAIDSEEVQIWTDIDGMHNNDPRYVDGTKPIRELSFDEAAELAYFGAKILHPSSIKPTRKKNIPVKLLNTLEPSASGTVISTKSAQARIKAVAAKDGITAIKIRSSEMLQAPGFLRKVFEVFELYHTSIDMITTSEVAVSVTIDDTSYLESIVKTLTEFGQVEVDKNLSIVCVVGEFLVESSGIASQVIRSLEDIPIRMISYGGSSHNISLLVSEEHKVNALNALHQRLF